MKEKTVIAALAAIGRLDGEEAWLLGRSARRAGIGPFAQMMESVARGYQQEKRREDAERAERALTPPERFHELFDEEGDERMHGYDGDALR